MKKSYIYYSIAIVFGIVACMLNLTVINTITQSLSQIFIKMFKCISMPIVSLSIINRLSCYCSDNRQSTLWQKTLFYTLFTTFLSAAVAALLYYIVNPAAVVIGENDMYESYIPTGKNYLQSLLSIIPDSISQAFIEHQVFSVLLISVILGIAINSIKESETKTTLLHFFNGLNSMFLYITGMIVKVLPIGLFAFVSVSIQNWNEGAFSSLLLGKYLCVIILANVIQGFIILPLILSFKGINPIHMFRGMFPALTVAFFSKSSSATLPVTIRSATENLHIKTNVSNFVLPICTTINMNGCAAFIFSTVIFVMQNNGINVDFITMAAWIFISVFSAIGNAAVPMGCYALSVSLLSSMNVPIDLLGIIAPFYSIVDMIETALNVWSDACVAAVVDKEIEEHLININSTDDKVME